MRANNEDVEGLLDEFESACLTYAGGPEFAKERQAERMVKARAALRRALEQRSSQGEPYGWWVEDPRDGMLAQWFTRRREVLAAADLTDCEVIPLYRVRPASSQGDGWRDIASAPRGSRPAVDAGPEILLWAPTWKNAGSGHWFRGAWRDDGPGELRPTHWRELPAPPAPGAPEETNDD